MAGNDGFSGIYPGFIFLPSDQVLLSFYLRRKIDGQADDQVFGSIPTVDLFGPNAPAPWLLHPAAATSSSKNSSSCNVSSGIVPSKVTDWFYCFARTSRRGSGSCRTTNCGTWLTSGGDKRVMGSVGGEEISVALGYKNTLAFKIPACGGGGSKWVPTSWVMHEFKLHRGHPDVRRKAATAATTKKNKDNRHLSEEEAVELVLCRIRCTKPMEPSEMSSGLGFGALQPGEEVERPQKRQRTGCSSDESGSHPELEPVRSEGEGGQASLLEGSSPSSSMLQYGFGSTYQLEQQQVVAPTTPAAVDVEQEKCSLQNPSVRTDLVPSPSSPCCSVQCGFWRSNSVEQQVVTAAGVNSAASFPDQVDDVNDCWMLDSSIDDRDGFWEMLSVLCEV